MKCKRVLLRPTCGINFLNFEFQIFEARDKFGYYFILYVYKTTMMPIFLILNILTSDNVLINNYLFVGENNKKIITYL